MKIEGEGVEKGEDETWGKRRTKRIKAREEEKKGGEKENTVKKIKVDQVTSPTKTNKFAGHFRMAAGENASEKVEGSEMDKAVAKFCDPQFPEQQHSTQILSHPIGRRMGPKYAMMPNRKGREYHNKPVYFFSFRTPVDNISYSEYSKEARVVI